MQALFHHRVTYVALAVCVIAIVVVMATAIKSDNTTQLITTTVERGAVEQLVTVSGIIEAKQTADLAFPVTGIVRSVAVTEGDEVEAGDTLITLETRVLEADLADAVSARNRAVATRNELRSGADDISRVATAENVTFKQTTLDTTVATQEELVRNARQTLLSQGLTAVSNDPEEDAIPPVISGTYQCDAEGSYIIDTYSSGSQSGYSFELSGLESGKYEVSTDQAILFGSCGLRIIFDKDSRYSNTRWIVTIPNTNSIQYVLNRNAYALAVTQAASAVSLAEQDLTAATADAASTNAPARSEALVRAEADITSAEARIARIKAQIDDRTITAPFPGTVTTIDILPGETVSSEPVVTVLAAATFELTARIPEIDIGSLVVGQPVRAVFDAKDTEVLTGTIDFISLQAIEIDGVSYYEALISLAEIPAWMRSGLNADIDIVVATANDVLRVPRRFITTNDSASSVQLLSDGAVATNTVDILLLGDDGFVALTDGDVPVGAVVVAPE